MKIPIGTRSVLFGVHQFLFHPLSVLLAWRRLYKKWPHWSVLICIFCHDLGYWGCPNIDGPEGKQHPYRGALLAARLVCLLRYGCWLPRVPREGEYGYSTHYFTLLHSRDAAKRHGCNVSPLYAADKASIIYDPSWFYRLRATLSGEIEEFKSQMIKSGGAAPGLTSRQWYDIYKYTVINRKGIKELL